MPKILLVEDNDLTRNMLQRRLARQGYEVITAEDGAEALATADRERPDVILMDLSMPVMDGWQATRALRVALKTADIPIIVLTALATSDARQRAFDAGCDEFATKPVDFPQLVGMIDGLVGPRTAIKPAGSSAAAMVNARKSLHDLNNQLGVIVGLVDLLLEKTPPEDDRRADLLNIQTAVEAAIAALPRGDSTALLTPSEPAGRDGEDPPS